MKRIRIIIIASFFFLLLLPIPRQSYAVIYGPNLVESDLNSNISSQYYLLTTDSPDPMDVFDWQGAEPWNSGFDSGISMAQPVQFNQKFLSSNIPLGFQFPMFGQNFESIQVSLNGWISFETNLEPKSVIDSARIPGLISQHPQRYALCPYWAPLYQTLQNGSVYCKYLNIDGIKGFSVQWHDVQVVQGDINTSMFFQCVFFEDGDIKFQYWSVGTVGDGSNATIGIKIDDDFVEFSRNSSVITDGFAIEFVATLTPPPLIKRTHAVMNPLLVNTTDEGVVIFHFFIEPRLSNGTIDSLSLGVIGNKGTNIPPQSMSVYIIRDYEGLGAYHPDYPIVSGSNTDGSPFLWDPWQNGDSVDIALYDSNETSDKDNMVIKEEGRKYYFLIAQFSDLILGDEYNFQITSINSTDIGTTEGFPIFVDCGTIKVATTTYPIANGPFQNPPLSSFTVRPDENDVEMLSFSVSPAREFNCRLTSFMVLRKGSAPGDRIYVKFYIDNGIRGVYEPDVDVNITASSMGSSTVSQEGYTLGAGLTSEFITVPLLNANVGDGIETAPTYFTAGAGSINILAICDFKLTSDHTNTTCAISLGAITFEGDVEGLVNLTHWGIVGSTTSVLLPEDILKILDAPAYSSQDHEFAVAGAKNVILGWFSAFPSEYEGNLQQIQLNINGTGNDSTDIANLEVLLDVNLNGQKDTDDWLLYSGIPQSDNPSFTIDISNELGRFYPWNGWSEDDLSKLLTFLVIADFSEDAQVGKQFRFFTSGLTIKLPDTDPITIYSNWFGPRIEIVDSTPPYFSIIPVEGDGVTIHTLPNSRVSAGVFKIYSGGSAAQIRSLGFSMPLQAWAKLTYFLIYDDSNNDSFPQSEEVLSTWQGSAGSPPTTSDIFYTTIGKVEVPSGGSIQLSVAMTFDEKPETIDSFMLTLEKVVYTVDSPAGIVWHSPITPNTNGFTLKVVDNSDEGGSVGFARGAALTVGTPIFINGGQTSLNLAKIISGTVENISIKRLGFTYSGTVDLQADYISSIRILYDDGNGSYDSTIDTVIDGTFDYSEQGRFYFYPAQMFFFPTQSKYIMLDIYFSIQTPVGVYTKVDLEPDMCEAVGIYFSQSGTPVERTTGTPPSIYGSKIQGSTVFVGDPTTTSDGDNPGDGGNPYDDSSGGGGGGCFIATSAFGSMSSAEVVRLCALRDNFLCTAYQGRSLTDLYYAISPSIARRAKYTAFCSIIRWYVSFATD